MYCSIRESFPVLQRCDALRSALTSTDSYTLKINMYCSIRESFPVLQRCGLQTERGKGRPTEEEGGGSWNVDPSCEITNKGVHESQINIWFISPSQPLYDWVKWTWSWYKENKRVTAGMVRVKRGKELTNGRRRTKRQDTINSFHNKMSSSGNHNNNNYNIYMAP